MQLLNHVENTPGYIESEKFVAYLVEEELKVQNKKGDILMISRFHITLVMRAGLGIQVSLIAHLQARWDT